MVPNGSHVELFLEDLVDFYSQNLLKADLMELFEVIRKLESGSFGSVLMVKDRETAQTMALKVLDKSRTSRESFLMEFSLSFFLSSHPNIIGSYVMAVETPDHFAFAQELSPMGDLLSVIPVNVGLPEAAVMGCAIQIASAMDFMETKGLVHLDIKPENILVFDMDCFLVKLTDFGLTLSKGKLISWKTGTKSYKSPELCQQKTMDLIPADPRMDVWALGVVLFMLLTGDFPWEMASLDDRKYRRFLYWQESLPSNYTLSPWKKIPASLHIMFHTVLAVDMNKRGKATDVLAFTEKTWKANISRKVHRKVRTKRKRTDLDPE